MVPYYASSTGVDGESIIRRGHQHHSIDHHGSDLKPLRVAGMKYPLRAQSREIARVDAGKAAIAPAGIVAVVRNPIRGHRLIQQILGAYIDGYRCGNVISRSSCQPGEYDR